MVEAKSPKPTYKIENLIPKDSKIPFDVRDIVRALVDDSEFFEVQALFAPNAIIGFSRINGETVGIIANQALVLAGVLDIDASDKIARFVRFCDAFNIPMVTLVDIPGYLPGSDQEHGGVIRHGAKVLYAYSEATVPKITVILRKAYGGGYIAMCSHHLRADFVFAWPIGEIAVMGPEGAANIIFKSEIQAAKNPEEMRKQKVKEYTDKFANPYVAASSGYVDAVIVPEETRAYIAHALKMTRNKEEVRPARKHGIPPF
jgi:acetyl-CoA carboxylase carboxyltransferase component